MKRPNILLISIDTLRADHVSCYGYGRRTTPNIDRVAGEGTVFLENYSTGVWTPPAHASMLTGLYVSEHGVYGERALPGHVPTVASVLREGGYRTAGFVNNSQVGAMVGLHKGHDVFWEVWKGAHYASLLEKAARGGMRRIRERLGLTDMGAARTNRLFRDWLEGQTEKTRPFYAFIHYIEAHNPFRPPRKYRKMHAARRPGRIDRDKVRTVAHNPLICLVEDMELNEAEVEEVKALYDGEISYVDSKVGEVVSILKSNGLYDDTMLIITSDHGEHFGEHGLWSHVASLHREVLKIPLVIKYPKGVDYVETVEGYTQLVDILPTVMDVAGIPSGESFESSGTSLVYSGNGNGYHEHVFAEWEGRVPYFIRSKAEGNNAAIDFQQLETRMSAVQDSRYKYVWKEDGSEEIYDISTGETRLESGAVSSEAMGRLRRELVKRRKHIEAVENRETQDLDEEIARNLRSLGYI